MDVVPEQEMYPNNDTNLNGDTNNIAQDEDTYHYSSEEIASFNKHEKRKSAAFGYDVYNNDNGNK